jgi:hypothetical protein
MVIRGTNRVVAKRYRIEIPSAAEEFVMPRRCHNVLPIGAQAARGAPQFVTCIGANNMVEEAGLSLALRDDPSFADVLRSRIARGETSAGQIWYLLRVRWINWRMNGLVGWDGPFPASEQDRRLMQLATMLVAEHRGVDPHSLDLWHGVDPWTSPLRERN